MLRIKSNSIKEEKIELEGVKKSKMQWLLSYKEGMPTFTIRKFRIKPKGKIPPHSHGWEHGIYILEGIGSISDEKGHEQTVSAGDVFYIEKNKLHGYSNPFLLDFVFLCIIPNKGDTRKTKYYVVEELRKEGKISCEDCMYHNGENKCTIAYAIRLQPGDCYYTVSGEIIGCKHGGERDERIE